MIVTAVVSNTLSVTRGVNGSSSTAHAKGTALAKVSAQMANNGPNDNAHQSGYLTTMRAERDIECMALPSLANRQTD